MSRRDGLPAVVLLVLGVLAAGAAWVTRASPDRPATPRPAPVASDPEAHPGVESPAVRVLAAWDARRADAWARGDAAALRGLYVAGSRAGAADARLLLDYRRRGLRVVGLRMQLLAVEVLHASTREILLRVTDRVAAAEAVGARTRTRLPRDRPSTRVVSLRRGSDRRWRVESVSDLRASPRGP
jgi:hypothetical protein